MATIQGLPTAWTTEDGRSIDLSVVPASPTSDHDPDRPAKVAAWITWAREVLRYRTFRHLECRDPQQQEIEWERCRRFGPAYFAAIWCFVHEPRPRRFFQIWNLIAPNDTPKHPGWLPAIPFPFQVDLIAWVESRLVGTGAKRRGAVSKPRDMGASWWICLVFDYHFLFDDLFSAKLISRREDEVYKPGKLNCLFGRLACHIVTGRWPSATLPEFLRPKGWIDKEHLQELIMINPENENIFTGESTSSRSGRGDRAQVGLVDEAAHIRELRELMGAIAQTVDCLILVSSEYVSTTDFWPEYVDALKRQEPEAVLELDYWMHPFHDQAYLAEEREAMQDDEAFAREILRDRWAGFSGWLYEIARDITPLANAREYVEGTLLAVGFDPGQDDETAVSWVDLDTVLGRDTVLEAYARRGQTPEWWCALILGCDPDDPALAQYGFRFGERERYLMEWTRSLPQPVIYGDPYGANATIRKDDTYYNAMRLFALKHNHRLDTEGNPLPLSIVCGWQPEQRALQHRRMATIRWLPRLDWNPTIDVQRTLHAIQNSRFDDPDKPRQAEQKDARHDALSHRRTSIEFIAVNLDIAYRAGTARAEPYDANQGSRQSHTLTRERLVEMTVDEVGEVHPYIVRAA